MSRSSTIDNRMAIALTWAILLLVSTLVLTVSADQELAYPFLHAVVEAVAALLALVIAWHSLTTYVASPPETHRLWVGLAFMNMGIFIALHGLLPKGDLSLWFRGSATLLGGILSLLVWIPIQIQPGVLPRKILIICTIVYPFIGVLCFTNQDFVPPMLDHRELTWVAKAISVVGGAAFIGSAVWFIKYRQYLSHASHWESVLQVSSYTLIGVSEILSIWSTIWDPLWWWCHIIRLVSYALMAFNAKTEFENGLVQQATQAAWLSEEIRSRVLVESAPCGMLMLETDGGILVANQQVRTMFGYNRNEILNKSIYALVPERFQTNSLLVDTLNLHATSSSRSNNASSVSELTGQRKDGTAFPIELGVGNADFSFGTKILVTVVDITARKQSEDVLRESKAQFKALAETAPVGIFQCDKDGLVTYANQLFLEMVGLASQDEVRQGWGAALHPEDHDRVLALWEQTVRTGQRFRSEHRFVHADGTVVWVLGEGSVVPGADRDVAGVIGTLTDITEDKLREEQFRLVVEAAPCGMLMINAKGEITLVNAQIETLFGYSRDELIGHPIESLIPVRFRNAHSEMRNGFARAPSARPMGLGRYLSGLRKNGTEFPVEIGLNPIQINGGICVLATVVDITERKRAEQRLEQQAADLSRSNHELEQFAYVASHDLQEPLRMVSSYCELLARRYKGKIDHNADEFIGFAVDGAKRMKTLIDDLLAYSRTGRRSGDLKVIDATEIVRAAISNLQFAIKEANAVVNYDTLPMVLAESSQLTQVFQNLIGNAIKFRGKQPPVICISACRTSEAQDIAHWQFSIRDNGIGFEQQYRDQVFIIFQRLHTRAEYPGNGMGLAIVKKIIEHHGGRIWVDSTPAEGTTFFFTLRGPLGQDLAAA